MQNSFFSPSLPYNKKRPPGLQFGRFFKSILCYFKALRRNRGIFYRLYVSARRNRDSAAPFFAPVPAAGLPFVYALNHGKQLWR